MSIKTEGVDQLPGKKSIKTEKVKMRHMDNEHKN